ncbi:guanylate kinase [Marvinbryantia formatexigens]|nr:guanylate kinase [Marvinbryantia formatexigens]UWO26600.1 guanylate kinase [Marvinbryantia formatexigens DSM 14469]SDH12480.1 Guanylate kinase [Marvinbryantia formatexigens]
MGKLFYIMGKSSTGKDTIFKEIAGRPELGLRNLVMYTTRPIREKETDGVEYHFVTDAEAEELQRQGKIIELRAYQTVHGIWKYFTVDDEHTDLEHFDYIAIGTLESYVKLREYYGKDRVVPIYIEVDDGNRLERALKRERKPQNRKFEEMCRRFLADAVDFSEENLQKAGITRRFHNDNDREECMQEVAEFIRQCQKEGSRA